MTEAINTEASKIDVIKTELHNIAISGFSVLTPLGNNIEQLFYAVQSGLNSYNTSDQMNHLGTQMTLSLVPDEAVMPLNEEIKKPLTFRQKRLLGISSQPLADAYSKLKTNKPLPLILSGPEKLPNFRTPIDDRFLPILAQQADVALDIENSYVLPHGRAGAYKALTLASKMLNSGSFEHIVIGAIDSYFDKKLLATLDSESRVLGQGVKDGFCPAEGACFALVSKAGKNSECTLYNVAETFEAGHLYTEEQYTGEALSMAVTELLVGENQSIQALCGTLNGESYYSKEWGVTQIRNSNALSEHCQILHPADSFGDLGSASSLINLALVIEAYKAKQLYGKTLLTASSEMGDRAALLVGG